MGIKSHKYSNESFYYENLRSSGFIYGNIIEFTSQNINIDNVLTNSELSKIVYLDAFFHAYILIEKNTNQLQFIEKSNAFFDALKPHRNNFLDKIIFKNSPLINLENNIDSRIYINENNFSKKFSNLITKILPKKQPNYFCK